MKNRLVRCTALTALALLLGASIAGCGGPASDSEAADYASQDPPETAPQGGAPAQKQRPAEPRVSPIERQQPQSWTPMRTDAQNPTAAYPPTPESPRPPRGRKPNPPSAPSTYDPPAPPTSDPSLALDPLAQPVAQPQVHTLPRGTVLSVLLTQVDLNAGPWTGGLATDLVLDGEVVAPAGTMVTGTLVVLPNSSGKGAAGLVLKSETISLGGEDLSLPALSDTVMATNGGSITRNALKGGVGGAALSAIRNWGRGEKPKGDEMLVAAGAGAIVGALLTRHPAIELKPGMVLPLSITARTTLAP